MRDYYSLHFKNATLPALFPAHHFSSQYSTHFWTISLDLHSVSLQTSIKFIVTTSTKTGPLPAFLIITISSYLIVSIPHSEVYISQPLKNSEKV
jgi:hypothetical protein